MPSPTAQPTIREAIPPVEATVLLVDLRNFTPNLGAASTDDDGVNVFCHFLSQFYAMCLDTSLWAMPEALRSDPPLHMSSTGDGVIVVFHGEQHVRHGFLAALLLHHTLTRTCEGYNDKLAHPELPKTGFGIGMESGKVSRIRALPGSGASPIVDTFIGNCINVAARCEGVTKTLWHASTIIASGSIELLAADLVGEDYEALMKRSIEKGVTDEERLELHDRMNAISRELCVTFIHQHVLKGVDRPLPLFRVSESSARADNPRFEALLARLTGGDVAHLAEVREHLRDGSQG